MDAIVETRKTTRRVSVRKTEAGADPFAEIVDATPVKKKVVRKAMTSAKTELNGAAEDIKPAKRAVRKTTKAVAADPFAETVEVAEPVKKRAVRVKKAVAETPVETPEPVKKRAVRVIKAAPTPEVEEAEPIKKRIVRVKKTDPRASESVGAKVPKKRVVRTKKAETVEARSVTDVSAPVLVESRERKTAKAVATEMSVAEPKKTVRKTTKKAALTPAMTPTLDVTAEIAASEPKVVLSPAFKALAEVSLPRLQRENRARLQMQTPTRLYLYWSVKDSPWATLKSVFGDDMGWYTLVLKLIDNKHGYEKLIPTSEHGNYWFDVEPDGSYKAEIGFYATNRPYFRIMHSNTIETPRRSPSPRAATDADWNVSANKFAQVLDVAGFTRDAFDVAMAGDDHAASTDASHLAFASLLGNREYEMPAISAEDIRYAMLALAAGVKLADLRWKVSETLFAVLAANAERLTASGAKQALTEHFDIDDTEFEEETEFGPAVFGASLVNFPAKLKTLKTRSVTPKYSPRYNPVSSHSLR